MNNAKQAGLYLLAMRTALKVSGFTSMICSYPEIKVCLRLNPAQKVPQSYFITHHPPRSSSSLSILRLNSIDVKYQIWKLGVVFTDNVSIEKPWNPSPATSGSTTWINCRISISQISVSKNRFFISEFKYYHDYDHNNARGFHPWKLSYFFNQKMVFLQIHKCFLPSPIIVYIIVF